jgi:hypothetical protein
MDLDDDMAEPSPPTPDLKRGKAESADDLDFAGHYESDDYDDDSELGDLEPLSDLQQQAKPSVYSPALETPMQGKKCSVTYHKNFTTPLVKKKRLQ